MDEPVALGRRAAQADSALFTVGFEASSALGKVVLVAPELPEVDGLVGSATPWSFRQLLYAASAELLTPPAPLAPNPPPKPPRAPFGSRLAHALNAAWNFEFVPPGNDPGAADPGGADPDGIDPDGMDPPGTPPPNPSAPPEGSVTPFFLRHEVNALADVLVDEEDDLEAELADVDFAALEPPPQAAATIARSAMARPTTRLRCSFAVCSGRRLLRNRGKFMVLYSACGPTVRRESGNDL